MARPTNNTRKLTRIGRSALGVMLPAAAIRELGWRERQRLLVKKVRGGILIRDAVTRKRKH